MPFQIKLAVGVTSKWPRLTSHRSTTKSLELTGRSTQANWDCIRSMTEAWLMTCNSCNLWIRSYTRQSKGASWTETTLEARGQRNRQQCALLQSRQILGRTRRGKGREMVVNKWTTTLWTTCFRTSEILNFSIDPSWSLSNPKLPLRWTWQEWRKTRGTSQQEWQRQG